VGDAPDSERVHASGLSISAEYVGVDREMQKYNRPERRAVGVPGGGAIANAASLALFYQGLLTGGPRGDDHAIWSRETLREGLRVRTGDLVDPMTGQPANRALGLVIAGDEKRVFRAFSPGNSPDAFGHAGAGGQIAWADPATGLSFAFLTSGFDRDPLRMGIRGTKMSSAAVRCAQPRESA
jgi:CubicO group peptidase (beta-lactamase class C family)